MLFKISADHAKNESTSNILLSLMTNLYFLLALVVYCGLTLLWVWILTRVPLSRAYPFVVLAFVFTPFLAWLLFDERIDVWYVAGMALILIGLGLLVGKAG